MNLRRIFIFTTVASALGVKHPTDFTDGFISAVPQSPAAGFLLLSALINKPRSASSAPAAQNLSPKLVAVAGSSTQINLFWTPSSAPGVKAYTIWRGTSSQMESFIGTAGLNLSFSDTDEALTKGTPYFYLVKAADGGTADATVLEISNEAGATTEGTHAPVRGRAAKA